MFQKIILGVIFVLAATIGCASTQDAPYVEKINPKYRTSFESTCAIVTHTFMGASLSGTGVLLDTGYIITARHVVDENRNGKIDKGEEDVYVKFFNKKDSPIKAGKLVWMAPKHDFAFIKLNRPERSKIRFATVRQYNNAFIGDNVYSFGHWLGKHEVHMTKGVISTSKSPVYGRTSMQVFYGGSGGAVFLERNGLVLGINTNMRLFQRHIVPAWTKFVRASLIRSVLTRSKKLHLIDNSVGCLRESDAKKFY